MDRPLLSPAADGEVTEQPWRLRLRLRRVSGLGSEAPLPDFSHSPPPHCYLFDLELPQQFLSQSFCINFCLPISSSFRSQLRGPPSSTVTPVPPGTLSTSP